MNPRSGSAASIAFLPPELLAHIFSYLSGPAPSDSRLHDQPSASMLTVPIEEHLLKPISVVNKQWRAVVLPLLFRHVLWSVDRWDLVLASSPSPDHPAPDPVAELPLLSFLHRHNLGSYVASLTLAVRDSMQGMYRLEEAGQDPDTTADPTSPYEHRMGTLLSLADARGTIKDRNKGAAKAAYGQDSNWLWDLLFRMMDPKRLTFIASPRMLASLLSRMLFLGDAWSFRSQCHIISLARDRKWTSGLKNTQIAARQVAPSTQSAQTLNSVPTAADTWSKSSSRPVPTRLPCQLFILRPWTALLLNEGSSTRVYKTYEFFLKRPPSILGALLGCEEAPNDTPLIPPTIRSLAYVGIFPLSPHFNTLITNLPRIDRLFIQLVPRDGILDDREEMKHIHVGDLWSERNTCYGMIMRELFYGPGDSDTELAANSDTDSDDDFLATDEASVENTSLRNVNNWRYLREFESGDAADKEAWDMAVQYVRMSATDWRVEREGVFVKRLPDGAVADEASGTDDAPTATMLALNPFHDADVTLGGLELLNQAGDA